MTSKGIAGIGLALVLVLISVGALLGALFIPKHFTSQVPVLGAPNEHLEIIGNLEFLEVGENEVFSLEPTCVDYGLYEFGKDWPLTVFQTGAPYYQSTWIWQRHGDTEACLTIWGPGEDGKTYDCEASRLVGYQKLEIHYENQLIKTMAKVQPSQINEIMPGYCWFNIILED